MLKSNRTPELSLTAAWGIKWHKYSAKLPEVSQEDIRVWYGPAIKPESTKGCE